MDNGFNMLINKETRNDAIIDHFYTNKVNKIESIRVEKNTTSDHAMIVAIRKMKINKVEETMIQTRNNKI